MSSLEITQLVFPIDPSALVVICIVLFFVVGSVIFTAFMGTVALVVDWLTDIFLDWLDKLAAERREKKYCSK